MTIPELADRVGDPADIKDVAEDDKQPVPLTKGEARAIVESVSDAEERLELALAEARKLRAEKAELLKQVARLRAEAEGTRVALAAALDGKKAG